ncbi:MAG: tRNA threonylcarbamoyladenosine dehydratase [Fibrobacter sp.]|nr:tRNA threonylcarbamoyladenosine dehydratase [Fibrobacter sp.]
MEERLARIGALVGENSLQKLADLRIIIFGVGGVGSVCAESLIRSGVCNLTMVDSDVVVESNINRQLPALNSTLGRPKVEVLRERFLDINPGADIVALQARYSAETREQFVFKSYDVVIDAIDSLSPKTDLLVTASEAGCRVFCSLGAAGKLDPTKVRTSSIWETTGCPLGKLVRNGLRKREFHGDFMAVYSQEPSQLKGKAGEPVVLGSAMPVTAAFGLALSSLVIRYAVALEG